MTCISRAPASMVSARGTAKTVIDRLSICGIEPLLWGN